MEDAHYKTLKDSEDSWWYRGRTFAVEALLGRSPLARGMVLDVGAGHGAMLDFLEQYGEVSAYEIYPECLATCRERGYSEVLSSEEALFAKHHAFALIGAFDVFEHIDNDVSFVSHLRTTIAARGLLVATVPAHQFLWSPHDVANRHFRRHSRRSLRLLLEQSGYEVLHISYWNCILLLPAALLRLLGRGGGDALLPPAPVNAFLTGILYLESLWLTFAPLPFGLSLIVIARPRSV